MAFGVIEYNQAGLIKCEVCGGFFKRPATHARQKHNTSALEYKKMFGLALYSGICSDESRALSRAKFVDNNQVVNGAGTRFKKGFKKRFKGRTREKLSEQTKLRLIKQFKK